MDPEVDKALTRTGRFVVYSLWIQSQLVDLLILNRHPEIIQDFNEQEIIPTILRDERFKLWQKDFFVIKQQFEAEFAEDLSDQAQADLDAIYYFRNAISHSHVSIGRKYLLYRPKSESILNFIKKKLNIINKNDLNLSSPEILKIDFSNDSIYIHNMVAIKRFDEIFIKNVCQKIGVFHQKIR